MSIRLLKPLLLLLVSCKGGGNQSGSDNPGSATPTIPPPPSGSSGSAPASSGSSNAAPAASFCFEPKGGFVMDRFTVTDDTAMLCGWVPAEGRRGLMGEGKRRCATASLSTGAFSTADESSIPPGAAPEPPLMTTADGKYKLRVDAKAVSVIEARTNKTKKLRVGDQDFKCVESARFLGETIYATASLCNIPRSIGVLYKLDGKQLGAKLEAVNLQAAQPFHLGGDRWAFHSSDNDGVLIVDVASGAQTRIDPSRPEHAANYVVAKSELPPLALTPQGKLVSIAWLLAVIDPASGEAENAWPLPVCKK